MYAWLAPDKKRDNVDIPLIPETFEWNPYIYDYHKFGYYYNYMIIKGDNPITTAAIKTLTVPIGVPTRSLEVIRTLPTIAMRRRPLSNQSGGSLL